MNMYLQKQEKNGKILNIEENSAVLYDARSQRWLLFRSPLEIHIAQTPRAVGNVLRDIEHHVISNRLYAVGFVAYEAAPAFDSALIVRNPMSFPLVWFGLYQKPEQIVLPDFPKVKTENTSWEPSISEDEYRSSIHRIKDYIRNGDTYQVNYTLRLRASPFGDPWDFFLRMIRAQGNGYGAFVNTDEWTICSASPELFFRLEGHELISRPMKGTISRGMRHTDDLKQADQLQHSEKNRAENVMIVDMVRNDMGRIADVGSVHVKSLFDIEKYPTLWQMTSTVRCTTSAGTPDIFRALFPPASITGAPKARTMHIISDLENTPRKIYTGTVGFITPERSAQFNVAIRTVLFDKRANTAEYGVGGGIVWDSEAHSELEECRTKAHILTRAIPDFKLLETLLWTPDNGYFLLDRHLDRLADSAAYFSFQIDSELIRQELNDLARRLPPSPHRIRLLVPREGRPMLESDILTPPPQTYSLHLAKQPVNSQNPFLYHKTSDRKVYDQALAECPGNDVLLWNEREEITESTIANVVVEMGGNLLTPPVSSGLLPGTYRSFLLEQGKIKEKVIHLHDLSRCAKIDLINSLRGMWDATLSD